MILTIWIDEYIRILKKNNHEKDIITFEYMERFKEPKAEVKSIKFKSNQEILISKNDGTLASWYINSSKPDKLDKLLKEGCLWLEDYLNNQSKGTGRPEKKEVNIRLNNYCNDHWESYQIRSPEINVK